MQKTPFLSLVAADLLSRFGNDLSQVAVIFPGRRARLFFNNYLCEHTDKPVWAPQYLTTDEIFQQAGGNFQLADNIQLVSKLYSSYKEIYEKHTASKLTETLDEFWFFGEILLRDFDDVDKNLVNAGSLFGNLQDLDQLRDDFTHLNESQIEVLMRYFNHTFKGETSLKTAFWSVWNILNEVYNAFKLQLKENSIAYPGMLMRSVIENESIEFPYQHYAFVGFNVLNKCEEQLFSRLRDKALFYWDWDDYYCDIKKGKFNEAGRFVCHNVQKFGSALSVDGFDNFLSNKAQITIVASASESGQSSYISRWLDKLNLPPQFETPESAVVLCNEQILPSVMHAIPPQKAENVNITMGFPITQSLVCSFIEVLAEMQLRGANPSSGIFRYKYVMPVLRHPYTQIIFPEAKNIEQILIKGNIFFPSTDILLDKDIFCFVSSSIDLARYLLTILERLGLSYEHAEWNDDIYSGLYQESVFRAYQVINRILGLMITGELSVEPITFLRLMRRLFYSTTVPFHGEPVKGLQVMGMLETRNLDFKNILLLSVNEGFLPGTNNENTFIPQFLRKHFGLNTIEHQDSIYAYYFYRLIQRAEEVTFVYNTDKTQTGKAEMSRFLLQLLLDPDLNIKRYNMQATVRPLQEQAIIVPKTDGLMDKIHRQFNRKVNPDAQPVSPSALNILIDCSLRFYLQYIENLRSKEELNDELDVSVFGVIFHRAAELLYRQIGNVGDAKEFEPFLVRKQHFDVYLDNPHLIDRLVADAFEEVFFKRQGITLKQYNGEQLINFRVIRHMLKRMITFDSKQAPFYICGLEKRVYADYEIPDANAILKTGGIIDRLEEKDGTLRIVDYKTGGAPKVYKEITDLITPAEKRASHIFQTYVYASILVKNGEKQQVKPSLLYLQEAGKEDYSSAILHEGEEMADFHLINDTFEDILTRKLSELFDSRIPFSQTTLMGKCVYCDFRELCNR